MRFNLNIRREIFIISQGRKKIDKVKENTKSPIRINTDIKIEKTNYKEEEQKVFYCSCCGKPYDKQKGNFPISYSPFYAGNNGYVTICNNCIEKYFPKLTDFFSGNEEKAIERFAQIFDWYYQEKAVAATRKISAGRNRVRGYPSKMCLPQTKDHGTTYLDTIRDRVDNTIGSLDNLQEERENGQTNVSDKIAKKWGIDLFSSKECNILEDHYQMLKRQNPNCDSNQEIFIKDLCYTKLYQLQALKDKKPDDFKKLTELYQDTFKKAGLKTIQETDSSSDETLGVTLATIAQYTPEEYYKNKKLYKDFDNIGDYFKRFVLRPFKNLITGSTERDKEYCVKDDENEED